MKRLVLAVMAGLVLNGCASGTGVVRTGPDSYMISKEGGSAFTSSGSLKADNYREAAKFCEKENKSMMPVGTNEIHASIGVFPQAELDFMCLDQKDPDLTRVRMEPVAPRAPSSN